MDATAILLAILIALVVAIVAFIFGYNFRNMKESVRTLEAKIDSEREALSPSEPEPTSTIIDPTDEVQNAQYEIEQMQKRINEPPQSNYTEQ